MALASSSKKKRKKNWYGIYAPKILNNFFLGESTVYSKDAMIGKKLALNLSAFTNDMRKQNTEVSFLVTNVTDNKAITEITGVALTSAYVKRLVRRGRNKIDDSFTTELKEKKIVRLKPIIITSAQTNRSVTSRIRIELRKILRDKMKLMKSDDLFDGLIGQKMQKELKTKLSKIYPLRYVDIRSAKLVTKRDVFASNEDAKLEKEAASDEEMKKEMKKEVVPEKVVKKKKVSKKVVKEEKASENVEV